jgi:hypothetical protein
VDPSRRVGAGRDVGDILDTPAFITEGGFLGWTDELLAAADMILWLDPPLPKLVWRPYFGSGGTLDGCHRC